MTAGARRRAAAAVAILLVATAALLVFGVVVERHAVSGVEQHGVTAIAGEQGKGHPDESGESTHAEPGAPADGANAGESVTVRALESPWVIGVGTIAAIALAVAVWRRPTRPVIAIVVAFTVAGVVFDIIEIGHQISERRIGLAVLAGVIVALRAATIAGAGYLYRISAAVK